MQQALRVCMHKQSETGGSKDNEALALCFSPGPALRCCCRPPSESAGQTPSKPTRCAPTWSRPCSTPWTQTPAAAARLQGRRTLCPASCQPAGAERWQEHCGLLAWSCHAAVCFGAVALQHKGHTFLSLLQGMDPASPRSSASSVKASAAAAAATKASCWDEVWRRQTPAAAVRA